jgi:hypothetical protein
MPAARKSFVLVRRMTWQSLSGTIDQIKNLARGVKGANDPSGDSLVSKAG